MNKFLAACRATGPIRLDIVHPGSQAAVTKEFHQPFVLIGAGPACDLVLGDDQVSGRHAYLQRFAGRLFCIDLGSRTGFRWAHGAEKSGWLDAGQDLGIGRCSVRVLDGSSDLEDGSPVSPLASVPPGSDSLPEVWIEFCNEAQKPWRISRSLTLIGSEPGCKIHLAGPAASRFHCSLVRTPEGIWALDLLSRQGIRVNDQPVRWARLDDGDHLQVAGYLLRFRYGPLARSGPSPAAANPLVISSGRPRAELIEKKDQWPAGPLTEPLLVSMVSQFAHMQQQMFDQFQQAILGMAQMFGSLHKDQTGLIREELQHLRELTLELNQLQAQAAKQPPPPSTSVNGHPALAAPDQPAPAPAPRPPSRPVAPEPAVDHSEPVESQRTRPAAGGGEEIHDLLSERLKALHQERQSRWQKVLGFLGGKRAKEPVQ